MTNYSISIVSDIVCPWCYVGYRHLQTAIAQHLIKHPADLFQIQWHPFQLNPDAPKHPSPIRKNTLAEAPADAASERLASAAKKVGIKLNPARRAGNTTDSHRLIELAAQQELLNASSTTERSINVQTRLVEELFSAFFESGGDITNHDVLAKAASKAGLARTEDDLKEFLAGTLLAEETNSKAAAARKVQGVNGVPHFIINDIFTVEGAQEPPAFLMLLERLKRKQSKI